MKKRYSLIIASLLLPLVASADNVGQCGWGSKLFDGQQGIAPQVLAVTTNGTSGNQTFAISLGTSGCSQMGRVRSSWRTAAFLNSNMSRVAKDMSQGQGESLDALASLMEIKPEHQESFKLALQNNFAKIFSSEEVSTETVLASIKNVLSQHKDLAQYATTL